MLNKTLDTVACILSLLIMLISFGCQKDEDELLIPANTTNENQGMLKSSTLTGIYPEGMVSYWKLDEVSGLTASDVAGDNDGRLINGPLWTVGQVVNALRFDGINDFVRIPNSNSLNFTEAVTAEAWVKPNGNPGHYQMLLEKGTWAGNASWFFFIHRDAGYLHYNFGIGIPGGTECKFCTMIGDLEDKVWSHIVGTYDRQYMKFYVNGELNNQVAWTEPIRLNPYHLYISYDPQGWYYKGDVDEVAIYNRALTACEVNQHYQNGLDGLGYELSYEPVQAIIDIDPNTLNLKSKGKMVTAYIELPECYYVTEIDIGTVYLECLEGSFPAKLNPSGVGDYDYDNIPDLMVKFDRQALIESLGEAKGEIMLTIKGEIDEAFLFEGSDVITVINP
jgi:hypothetical protein